MGADVVMPRLSDSMEEGTILTWLKKVGDDVAVGDELVEIETDKANMAYEADVAGKLHEILAQEGDVLPVGAVIAKIGEPHGASASGDDAPQEAPRSSAPEEPERRVKASPLARRLASEKGLALAGIIGSGPGGRIVKDDVERAATAGPPAGPAGAAAGTETAKGKVTVEEPSQPQRVVARRMSESKATAPHFYLESTIDMSRAVKARARIKAASADGGVVPSLNDMVVKACALALKEFPRANGAYRDGRFELYERINVGIAVAAQNVLLVPTIFDADRKGLRGIAAESRALAERARSGEITPPELSGGTFTVSNLGMFGITNFAAVINAPQAAILAVGAIEGRPAVRGGEIATAHLMDATLSCDHRILYGADGARFLARVRALLEEPLSLAF